MKATPELQAGDRVQLTDEKGKLYSFYLVAGAQWHSHKGWINHDSIIGLLEGSVVLSSNGSKYQVMRPLLNDYILSMPRGATIVYPKDSALIVGYADVFPGAKVLEAGAGSGALSISLLRAIGVDGELVSVEARSEFLDVARENVSKYFGYVPKNWKTHLGRVQDIELEQNFDRVIYDMLAPWDALDVAARALKPGGVICCYVATTTQLSRIAEAIKESGLFSEPESFESLIRYWHHEGLAVRPQHSMNAHTGFLLISRKMAQPPIKRRRRPAKGAYSLLDGDEVNREN
ncbi:MAG: tRNA (adenine-N1)-methyltransferase [Candidatus Nanopelagicaceae bacterium]|jgi:tRNA (adenine57-N1/adenine58-N1)-methyltransferase